MNPEELKAAGFTDDEITEYTNLKSAGFGDDEIQAHYQTKNTPKPEEPWVSKAGKKIANVASEATNFVKAPAEIALSLLTALPAYYIGKTAGGFGSITNPGEGQQIRDFTQNMYTYMPEDPRTRFATEKIGGLLSLPFYPAQKVEEYGTKLLGPELGMSLGTGVEGLTAAFMPWATGKTLAAIDPIIARTNIPERMAASSVRMPLSKKWVKARGEEETSFVKQAAETMVKDRVRPSELGKEKNKGLIKEGGKAIDEAVENIPGTASLEDITLKGLKEAREKALNGENTAKDLEAIDAYETAFKESHGADVTPVKLQKIKRRFQELINWDKQRSAGDSLTETMRKGLAAEARLKLEEMNPQLKQLNKTEQGRILLDEALERSLARRSNRDIISLGTKVLVGRESWPLAILNATLGHPQVKATIAFMVDNARTAAKERIAKRNPTMESFTPEPTGLEFPFQGPYATGVPATIPRQPTGMASYQGPYTPFYPITQAEQSLANLRRAKAKESGFTYREGVPESNILRNPDIDFRFRPYDWYEELGSEGTTFRRK
jgi:hypothetical protein